MCELKTQLLTRWPLNPHLMWSNWFFFPLLGFDISTNFLVHYLKGKEFTLMKYLKLYLFCLISWVCGGCGHDFLHWSDLMAIEWKLWFQGMAHGEFLSNGVLPFKIWSSLRLQWFLFQQFFCNFVTWKMSFQLSIFFNFGGSCAKRIPVWLIQRVFCEKNAPKLSEFFF